MVHFFHLRAGARDFYTPIVTPLQRHSIVALQFERAHDPTLL
jgi:hypothetical protein